MAHLKLDRNGYLLTRMTAVGILIEDVQKGKAVHKISACFGEARAVRDWLNAQDLKDESSEPVTEPVESRLREAGSDAS